MHCFDEEENLAELCYDRDCFPLATQKTSLGPSGVDSPFTYGWCVLNLGLEGESAVTADIDFPGHVAQSFVASMIEYSGQGTVGLPAAQLQSACELPTQSFLEINLFRDGFESGDTSGWSLVVP